jgi:deazaflavin-dependent oxidoreductase (nitroreductase family)
MNGNGFVTLLLHSPFQGALSANTMLITVTGRKTGKEITTPVNYYQEGDTVWVISRRERTWWRNARHGASVKLYLRGKDLRGVSNVLEEEDGVVNGLGHYIQHFPASAKYLKVRMDQGIPNADDLRNAAGNEIVVCIKVC